MERKKFLRNSIGLFSTAAVLNACKKDDTVVTGTGSSSGSSGSSSCIVMPEEGEGPYPYPTGEINNPLNRSDITGGQTGVPLTLDFTVVNTNNDCAAVSGARVDIWHCNKDGYYSGYANIGIPGIIAIFIAMPDINPCPRYSSTIIISVNHRKIKSEWHTCLPAGNIRTIQWVIDFPCRIRIRPLSFFRHYNATTAAAAPTTAAGTRNNRIIFFAGIEHCCRTEQPNGIAQKFFPFHD